MTVAEKDIAEKILESYTATSRKPRRLTVEAFAEKAEKPCPIIAKNLDNTPSSIYSVKSY